MVKLNQRYSVPTSYIQSVSPPHRHTHTLPHYQHLAAEWYITIGEPVWTHQCHPKSIVYVSVHSWCCTLYGSDKCVWCIIQNGFTVLKILCVQPVHPFLLPTDNHWSFYCLRSLAFSRMSYGWNHIVYSLFSLVSFT